MRNNSNSCSGWKICTGSFYQTSWICLLTYIALEQESSGNGMDSLSTYINGRFLISNSADEIRTREAASKYLFFTYHRSNDRCLLLSILSLLSNLFSTNVLATSLINLFLDCLTESPRYHPLLQPLLLELSLTFHFSSFTRCYNLFNWRHKIPTEITKQFIVVDGPTWKPIIVKYVSTSLQGKYVGS